jgi:CheY-like chemotaxis protein
VLLDLNLPKMEGPEVVEVIKSDPELGCIPLVILTSSSAERDVGRCYELKANAYVTKPSDVADFISAISSIKRFWLETVRLPSPEKPSPAAGGAP